MSVRVVEYVGEDGFVKIRLRYGRPCLKIIAWLPIMTSSVDLLYSSPGFPGGLPVWARRKISRMKPAIIQRLEVDRAKYLLSL